MDKKIAGLLGAAAALTTLNSSVEATQTQVNEPAPAANYRDLLGPIPNALALLKADDARRAETAAGEVAQYYPRERYHHHHHHHHHSQYLPPIIRQFIPRPYYHDHHHHHHHDSYYRGGRGYDRY